MPRIVEPWYESKFRCTAMPPASANAIASRTWRLSKYFSRISGLRTDRTVSAQVASPLGVFGPEAKVTRRDACRGFADPSHHQVIVRIVIVLHAAPHVEEPEPWDAHTGQTGPPGRHH